MASAHGVADAGLATFTEMLDRVRCIARDDADRRFRTSERGFEVEHPLNAHAIRKDLAHRIGQSKVVTSYKLITRGTVEEKILNLQQRKREIIAATLSSEEAFTEALTWEEIQSLFS